MFGIWKPTGDLIPADFMNFAKLADLDGDGDLDLVGVALHWPPRHEGVPLRVFLGDGAGGFRADPSVVAGALPAPVHGREIVLGDLNADGRVDVFLADHGYDAPPFPGHPNWLLLSGADGRLHAAELPALSAFTHSAAFANIDGDGDLDVYVGDLDGPHFLVNDGAGGLEPSYDRLPSAVRDGADGFYVTSGFGDLDGDGDPDLVLGSGHGNEHRLLLNDGSGRFQDFQRLPGIFGAANTISIDVDFADLDRDGRAEIIFTSTQNDPFYQGSGLQILALGPDGDYLDVTGARIGGNPDPAGRWTSWTTLADVDQDGHLDLLRDPAFEGRMSVHLGASSGDFVLAHVEERWRNFEFGDVDGNGTVDAVAYNGGGIEVFLNVSPSRVATAESGRLVTGTALDDAHRGTSGVDTFVVAADRDGSLVTWEGRHASVFSQDGVDALVDFERIAFRDGVLALDVGGHAGQAFRLYQAAFGRDPDARGLSFWVDRLDSGRFELRQAAEHFASSAELAGLLEARGPSNDAYVEALYANVLGRAPDPAGLAFWTSALSNGSTRGEILLHFSESAENVSIVGATIDAGIWLGA